jgi:galactokinase
VRETGAAESAWRAPGRVNLIGEHTDYNNGFVLPFAIGRSVRVTGTRRADGRLEVRSLQEPGRCLTLWLDDLSPGAVPGWAAYPAGVAWALGQAGHQVPAASLAIDSDLPSGAGLASSAALECAVAGCLADLAGVELPRLELARLARRAENDFVGVPCGIMDQYAAMLCHAGKALLLDCLSEETADIPLDLHAAGLRLVVIDTGVRHDLAGGEYAARREECERAAALLGVASLREVTSTAALERLAGPDHEVIARRARHVVTESARVIETVELLRADRLAEVGPLLTASHQSLRDDFEVSWPEADLAVAAAINAGALGARMTGGGFGGCVLALVPVAIKSAMTAAIVAAFGRDGLTEPAILDVAPSRGAQRVAGGG